VAVLGAGEIAAVAAAALVVAQVTPAGAVGKHSSPRLLQAGSVTMEAMELVVEIITPVVVAAVRDNPEKNRLQIMILVVTAAMAFK
jgi:hypothetical protein